MTEEQFREAVWDGLFVADYEVRYWELYQDRIRCWAIPIRIVLGLSSVLSLVGLIVLPSWQLGAAILAAAAALVATILIPAFGWDDLPQKVGALRNDWIDLRNGYQTIWNDIDDVDQVFLEKLFASRNARDVELEQRNIGLPRIQSFRERAFDETQDLLLG